MQDAARAILRALPNEDEEAQIRAVRALRELKYVAPLIEYLDGDKPAELRRLAAIALGAAEPSRAGWAADALIAHLDDDPAVSSACERSLYELGEFAVPRLLSHFHSQGNAKVKDILIRLGHRALPVLIAAAASGDEEVVPLIERIFETTGEKTARSALRAFSRNLNAKFNLHSKKRKEAKCH